MTARTRGPARSRQPIGALTPAQQRKIAAVLTPPCGVVDLICDADWIRLEVQHARALTYRVFVYVNGDFRWAWSLAEEHHPEQKYMRRTATPLYGTADLERMRKIFGAKAVNGDPRYKKQFIFFRPDFASGRAALAHLSRVCATIRAPDEDEMRSLREVYRASRASQGPSAPTGDGGALDAHAGAPADCVLVDQA
ncbi:hypothetical protein [Accumulibacter sp.]|uniref:hypothetical protein n=1 Tax=Accumulibacter sp. TaxID=2053492 RepID=UPI0028795773|nr:hypothetical protein [Accumulibacter sp.]MDS4056456.1 hypothetical protein [Accumulibacter sp.]HMW56394.1 hypothetical protein [Accumulibacter sp.]HMW79176.1 hypothetical protein [Accumulibacter sp.]HNC66175.1 hypothetical protein [Thauera aminoaromatica]